MYPEATLTSGWTNPVTISTERSVHALQPVRQEGYVPQRQLRTRPTTVIATDPYGGWGWGGWTYGRPYWGSGVIIRTGPRYYGDWGGGFRGGRRRQAVLKRLRIVSH